MKIGILTSTPSFINNYGAVLQAYALQTQLKKIGVQPYIIKYADSFEYVRGKVNAWQRIKGTILNPRLSFREKKKLIYNKLTHQSVYPVFMKFQNQYIDFYNDNYMNYQELKEKAKEFSAFIVGSDQVWNPKVHHGVNDPGYFLQFVPKGIKRIAYAPSMGVNALPEKSLETLNDYISSFDAVSIREESGRRIIKEYCGLDIPVVLDPTLLLDKIDYDLISDCSINPSKPYILCYLFGNNQQVEHTVLSIAKAYGYEIVNVPASLNTHFKTDYNIGPKQFIGLISKASLVCTDSFHATVFSIIYKRQFLSFARENEQKAVNMNSRITDLLRTLGLMSRWCGNGDNLDVYNIPIIDYDLPCKLLNSRRQECIEYLKKALEL